MLLTRDKLIDRLRFHLKLCTHIDIAVAWACDCDALDLLCQFVHNGGSLRAVVGIGSNVSHPHALRAIQKCSELRIAPTDRLFHPKFYLFRSASQQIAWIGSSNLTRPGFQQNEEIVFEFLDEDGEASKWFNGFWKELGDEKRCEAILAKYEANWKPPSRPPRSIRPDEEAIVPGDVYELGRSLTDWASFVAAIEKAKLYWAYHWGYDDPVTGDAPSWLDTITRGRAVARMPDWSDLSSDDWHLLLGRSQYGLLGGMGGAGKANTVFNIRTQQHLNVRRKIRKALQPVIDAQDADFVEQACRFIAVVNGISGFSGGLATRLLTLARPDRGISVNGGSKEHLAALTGLPKSSLSNPPHGRARSYLDLLRWFEKQPWYSNPTPKDVYERMLVEARAALVDAFVYEQQ